MNHTEHIQPPMNNSFTIETAAGDPPPRRDSTAASHETEDAITERVLVQFMQSHPTLVALAEALGMSLSELSQWSARMGNWRALAALSRLGDMHVRMTIGRFRITAAAHLLSIASGKDSTELARRACADLLDARVDSLATGEISARRSGGWRAGPAASPGWPDGVLPSISAPAEREIMNAFEALGQDQFDPPSVPSAISQGPPD